MTLMLAMLMLASCSKKQGSCLIPDNAIYVLRLDMLKLLGSTGEKGDDDSSVKDQLKKLIKEAHLDEDASEKFMEIIDDPTSSGIDFTEPLYVYLAASSREGLGGMEGGLVGSVDSKGNLAEVIEALEKVDDDVTLEEYDSDGVQYVMLGRKAALIFNGDWFYIGPVERGDDWEPNVDATIEMLLERADGKDNIEDNEAFKQMCEAKGVMQMLFNGSGFEGLPGIEEAELQLPEGCEFKDIAGFANFIINEGEVVVEGEAILLSDAWKKQSEKIDYKTIEKSQAKYADADADGALAIINIDPKGLFDYVKTVCKNAGLSRGDLEKLDEMKPIVDALTGKGIVAINGLDENDEPKIVAYVGTRNSELLNEFVEERIENDNVINVAPNRYNIPIDYDYEYNDSIGDWEMIATKFMQVGWKDSQTYFLLNTDEEPFDTPRHSFADVKGKGFYLRISGELAGNLIGSVDYYLDRAGRACADLVDYAEAYMESPTKSIFRISMKKKDQSPIATFIDYLKKHLM